MPLRSNPRTPSSLACVPCRQRHLRCDAVMPPCSRCEQSNVKCYYVASKRGLRQKATTATQDTRNPATESFDSEVSYTYPFYTQTLTPTFSPDISVNFNNAMFPDTDKFTLDWLMPVSQELDQAFPSSLDDEQMSGLSSIAEDSGTIVTTQSGRTAPISRNIAFDPMMKLYYQNFHASHPFIIPQKALGNSDLARLLPSYLLSMMQYVGSHFHPDPSAKDRYRKNAYMGLNESPEATGFKVQAMLLAAIVDHADGNEEQAGYRLKSAVIMASQLGMQSGSFGGSNSYGNVIFEESWRRTFWELFIVVHLFKTFSGQHNCDDIQLSGYQDEDLLKMELPCDEATYFAAGTIPKSKTLLQLQNSWRILDNHTEETFSSFAYRIEATRLWGMVQSANSRHTAFMHVDEIELETLDIRFATFMIRLMKMDQCSSSSSFNDLGYQMRSQAQMFTLLAIIYLHHPQSKIGLSPWKRAPVCIASGSPSFPEGTVDELNHHKNSDPHSLKALRAAGTLLNMITNSVLNTSSISPIQWTTPFMICAVTMSLMVHVVDAHHHALCHSPNFERNCKKKSFSTSRIELGMRTLDILGEVWPLARSVKRQLLDTFHEVPI
ncbi:C6 transcription factor, putative [Talaromyces marneffei ATCC 18224]|uniref:C6 transcription factor, putative n=1 Tax=Talaromyces marneffei (strain ATCC 18224 / CBS 334.59 / QM 7333) TaxID=441960 RepID=B6QQX9_TALMQ|nr:C6 transcription factor, putative [Talaromyces marneffei ATCC 18224]